MAARIIIERRIKRESLGAFLELSLQLRAMAILQQGYISGETLVAADRDDIYLVISTWRNHHDWKAWEQHPDRIKIAEKIEDLLAGPSRVEEFINVWGSAGP